MSLKFYTSPGNLASLKVLLASATLNVKIELLKSENNASPSLVIDDSTHLFSANAAVTYLFRKYGKEAHSTTVDSLIEFEATQLQPSVVVISVAKTVDTKTSATLTTHLKYLDSILCRQYLTGDVLTSADIVVWSCLYPVLSDDKFNLRQHSPKLSKWFDVLSGKGEFQASVEAVTGGKGVSSLKESLEKLSLCSNMAVKTNQTQTKCPNECAEVNSETNDDTVSAVEVENAKLAWTNGRKTVPNPREQKYPKLPIKGERNILITSALPYVNNVPHLGNIIGCVLSADVFSRYCRLRNYNALYLCGTDEYGTATETKALAEGLTPAEICTKYNKIHSDVYNWFNIDFDYFGRTTTDWQTKISQDIFWKLYHGGYILKDSVEQLKCENCDRFLADRFVEGTCPLCKFEDARGDQCDGCGKLLNATDLLQPKCKLCSQPPCIKTSNHLFLDLPQLTEKLSNFLETRFTESSLWSANAKLITKSWLRDGLKPRCITRDLKWGTPVPLEGYTDKVFYVWFDAPIGYLSIGATYHEDWEKWWKNPDEVELYQFLGKDNVPFHSVIFPATLLGANDNFTLLSHLSATEYLNYEDTKFSKSRGTGVFGNDASETIIPADIWRFYLLFVRPESQDSTFSWDDFMLKNNSELLNNLGNFINRALTFVTNFFDSTIPEMKPNDEDYTLLAQITKELQSYVDDLEHLRLRDGLRKILNISRLGNQFMQANKPWVLVKGSSQDKSRAGTVVGLAANVSCLLSVLLQPYMPHVSSTIQSQLAAPQACNYIGAKFVCYLESGHRIGKPSPLFTKLDSKLIEDYKKKYAGQQKPAEAPKSTKQQKIANNSVQTNVDVDALNVLIAEQGIVVRELKVAKAEKEKIAVEVEKLLALKKQLAAVTGAEVEPSGGKKKKNKKK